MSSSSVKASRSAEKIESIRIHNYTQHSTRVVLVHSKGKNDLMIGARSSRAVLCPAGWFDVRVYSHSHEKSYVAECRSVHTVCKNLIIRQCNFGKGYKDLKNEPRIFLGYQGDQIVDEDDELKIDASHAEKMSLKPKEIEKSGSGCSNGEEKSQKAANSEAMEVSQPLKMEPSGLTNSS